MLHFLADTRRGRFWAVMGALGIFAVLALSGCVRPMSQEGQATAVSNTPFPADSSTPDALQATAVVATPDPPHHAPGNGPSGPSLKLIPNSELVFGPSVQGFDVRTFASGFNGYLLRVEEEVEGQMLDGPAIVELLANRYSINPRLLLAVLEHQSGWVTQSSPTPTEYPLGYAVEAYAGLLQQLGWAANLLNLGFYGRSDGGLTGFTLRDGTAVAFAPEINHGTAGVQLFFGAPDGTTRSSWETAVGPDGFITTYRRLFGEPFAFTVEPLLPSDLAQPALKLPWASGETWYFTGGPHAAWNSGSAWAALDFVPPGDQVGCYESEAWVTAVADGIITRSSFGGVVLDLDGDGYAGTGWTIHYLHLAANERVAAGTRVQAGDRLGHPSCEGGISNGTHVHVARAYNGRWISADGGLPFVMSGWVSSGAGIEYDGWLTRGADTREACVCREDVNAISH